MHFVQIGDNNRAGDYRVIINPGVECGVMTLLRYCRGPGGLTATRDTPGPASPIYCE